METTKDWIQIAYMLSKKRGTSTPEIEKAMESHEKLKKKLIDAQEYIGKLSEKEHISDEEMNLAQVYYLKIVVKARKTQKSLFESIINSCISSLERLCAYSESENCSEDDLKELEQISTTVCEKIKESKIPSAQFTEMEDLAKRLKF